MNTNIRLDMDHHTVYALITAVIITGETLLHDRI